MRLRYFRSFRLGSVRLGSFGFGSFWFVSFRYLIDASLEVARAGEVARAARDQREADDATEHRAVRLLEETVDERNCELLYE